MLSFVDEHFIFNVPSEYRNLKDIAVGTFGIVVSAYDTTKNEFVAIKKICTSFLYAYTAQRTYRELMVLKGMNHPNIISLLNVHTPQNSAEDVKEIYLFTDLMHDTMKSIVSSGLDNDKLSYLMYQILCGLKYLHASGIIHRDLKPGNIGIKADGSLKILDFGFSRAITPQMRVMTNNIVSRPYRAPEVIMRKKYGGKVDIWSLGCIFGEMLKGSVLFDSKCNFELIQNIVKKLGTPSEAFRKKLSCPENLKRIVRDKPHQVGVPFDQLFPDSMFERYEASEGKKCSTEAGRDLLTKMLKIDPDERICVEEAIKHSFVKPWFNEAAEYVRPANTYPCYLEESNMELKKWKELIFKEIKEFKKI